MKLWTWQNKDLFLTEGHYEPRKHSEFYWQNEEAYEKLWEEVETDQFIWCYLAEEEAKRNRPVNISKLLWELDVPKDAILEKGNIDSVAWHCIVFDDVPTPPPEMSRPIDIRGYINKWKMKIAEKKLWEILFLDEIKPNCSQLLVPYPVKKCWIL